MTVRICDLMHKGVISCYPNDSVKEIAKMMDQNQIRCVVVTDETGEVWGTISIMELLPLFGKNLEEIQAQEIMRPYKIEIDPQWSVQDAVQLMKKRKLEHLIIIDPHAGPRRPIGILTSFDIVQFMAGLNPGHFELQLKMHTEKNLI